MSSTFPDDRVSLGQLKRIPGSKDQGLIEAIAEPHKDCFVPIDELAANVSTCRQALEQIVNGELLEEHLGDHSGHALEAICSHLGEELEGVHAIRRASGWIDPVDAFLKDKGVLIALTDLVFGKGPIDLPTPEDLPDIGCWRPKVIADALKAIQGVEMAGFGFETAESLRLIHSWLEAAPRTPGSAIVGVLS